MRKPLYISNATWDTLKPREKDFVLFVASNKYSKEQIMKKLYISNRSSYWRIRKIVTEKLKNDVAEYNKNKACSLHSC